MNFSMQKILIISGCNKCYERKKTDWINRVTEKQGYIKFRHQETCLWGGEMWACVKIWIQRHPDRGDSKCKSPKMGTSLVWMETKTSTGKNKVGKTSCYKWRERPVWKK